MLAFWMGGAAAPAFVPPIEEPGTGGYLGYYTDCEWWRAFLAELRRVKRLKNRKRRREQLEALEREFNRRTTNDIEAQHAAALASEIAAAGHELLAGAASISREMHERCAAVVARIEAELEDEETFLLLH
jgi:hypothetical protein